MALSFNGTTQYANFAGVAGITAYPASIACWIKFSDASATFRDPFGQGHTTDINSWMLLQINTTHKGLFGFQTSGTGGGATGTTVLNDGAWHHLCGVANTATDRKLYVDGSNEGSSTVNVGFPTLNTTNVAVFNQGGTLIQYFPGNVAECAMWNVALSANDIVSLSKGFSPLLISPSSLKAYWRLLGQSTEIDLSQGNNLTLNNTPTVSSHARVLYPANQLILASPTATTDNPVQRRRKMLVPDPTFEHSWGWTED